LKAIIGARKVILNETAQTNNDNESVLVKLSIIILKAENVMVKVLWASIPTMALQSISSSFKD